MKYILAFKLITLILLCSTSLAFAEQDKLKLIDTLLNLAPRISPEIIELAAKATQCAMRHDIEKTSNLAIIDYSLPSTKKRFWLFDLQQKRLLLEDFVAHGKNSGENYASSFSNKPGSLQSSLGLFRAGDRYIGKHGNSLRLIGLEPGYNDLALDRAIVIHGANYVSTDFVQLHQRLGRSFGCPALAPASAEKVINALDQHGGYLFAYYPDNNWIKNSSYLNSCHS